jgi:hypothetical protein
MKESSCNESSIRLLIVLKAKRKTVYLISEIDCTGHPTSLQIMMGKGDSLSIPQKYPGRMPLLFAAWRMMDPVEVL